MAYNLTSDIQVAGQELFSASTAAVHEPGARAVTPDGRGFRYVKNGASTLTRGNVLQGPAESTANFQNLAVAATAIGATSVVTTTTVTLTANQVASGWLVVTVTPGLGDVYKIKSHPAVTAAVVTFTLEDPIRIALTTSSRIDVVPNPYSGVIQNPTTTTGNVVGAAVYALQANAHGWIQTHGPAPVLAQAAIVVGQPIGNSRSTAGAVTSLVGESATAQVVGYAITGIADTETGLAFLTID